MREIFFVRGRAKLGFTVFYANGFTKENENRKRKRSLGCARDDETRKCLFPFLFIPRKPTSAPSGNAIKLSGRTFLAPHRGSCPEGLCKRTGFLGVKQRENPVRRHFERSEMRGQHYGISNIVRWPLACPYCLRHFPRRGKQVITALTISLT